MASSATLTVRLPKKVKDRLGELARHTRRTRSYLAGEAIASFVDREIAIVEGIKRGLREHRGQAGPHRTKTRCGVLMRPSQVAPRSGDEVCALGRLGARRLRCGDRFHERPRSSRRSCRVAGAIRTAASGLAERLTGHPGRVAGTYERLVHGLRYIIAYGLEAAGEDNERVVICGDPYGTGLAPPPNGLIEPATISTLRSRGRARMIPRALPLQAAMSHVLVLTTDPAAPALDESVVARARGGSRRRRRRPGSRPVWPARSRAPAETSRASARHSLACRSTPTCCRPPTGARRARRGHRIDHDRERDARRSRRFLGLRDEVADITRRAMNDDIDFAAGRARVALLAGIKATPREAARASAQPGASAWWHHARARRLYRVVSGGFSLRRTGAAACSASTRTWRDDVEIRRCPDGGVREPMSGATPRRPR